MNFDEYTICVTYSTGQTVNYVVDKEEYASFLFQLSEDEKAFISIMCGGGETTIAKSYIVFVNAFPSEDGVAFA